MRVDGERGQSLIEVILLGLLFFIPVIWMVGVLADMHRAALGSSAAAREAGTDAARASNPINARRAVEDAVVAALVDHGLDPSLVEVQWETGRDLERGSFIEIDVSYPVPVLQAPLLGRVSQPSVWVNASHVSIVEPYASRDDG